MVVMGDGGGSEIFLAIYHYHHEHHRHLIRLVRKRLLVPMISNFALIKETIGEMTILYDVKYGIITKCM